MGSFLVTESSLKAACTEKEPLLANLQGTSPKRKHLESPKKESSFLLGPGEEALLKDYIEHKSRLDIAKVRRVMIVHVDNYKRFVGIAIRRLSIPDYLISGLYEDYKSYWDALQAQKAAKQPSSATPTVASGEGHSGLDQLQGAAAEASPATSPSALEKSSSLSASDKGEGEKDQEISEALHKLVSPPLAGASAGLSQRPLRPGAQN